MKSYRDLDIYTMAYDLAIQIHHMSLRLPKYELYEQGSQIRRSSKTVKDAIVEGYGRKRYKQDFIRYLTISHSSCDETISQLNMINDLHFSNNELNQLIDKYEMLSKKIFRFREYVEHNWNDT